MGPELKWNIPMDGVFVCSTDCVLADSIIPLAGAALDWLRTIIASRVGRLLFHLKVDIHPDRGVVLLGEAKSYFAKQIAQQATIEVTGLRILANRIVVVREK
jgi:hypothetical protein